MDRRRRPCRGRCGRRRRRAAGPAPPPPAARPARPPARRAARRSPRAAPPASSSVGLLGVLGGGFDGLLGSLPLLTRDHVGGVPGRPVMLRGRWLVFAVVLLGLAQQLAQSLDLHRQLIPV